MLQFFYMGYILELEDPEVAIEPHQQQISELIEFSLIRGRDGLGGLAEYLVEKLSTKGLVDSSIAVQRLDLAMSLATSVGADARIQVSSACPRVCMKPAHSRGNLSQRSSGASAHVKSFLAIKTSGLYAGAH